MNKVYDGTTAAIVTLSTIEIAGDSLSTSYIHAPASPTRTLAQARPLMSVASQ
jgi:hypothetical protein